MKKIIMSVVALAIISMTIGFVGCKKETLKYSCDKDINAWAVENENSFHNITRKQLVTLPYDLQLAAFRTLTPEEKSRLWQDKFNTIYDDWDITTRSIIDKLAQHITPQLYDSEYKSSIDTVALNKIQDELISRMDTTDYVINFCMLPTEQELDILINEPETLDRSWINIPEKLIPVKAQPEPTGNCNCSRNITCSMLGLGTCSDTNCKEAGGCGLAGHSTCKKACTILSK